MTGATVRERFTAYAEKASDLARQLGFAILGVIWIFKQDVNGRAILPGKLVWPALLVIAAMGIDLFHYTLGALIAVWASKHKRDDELQSPVLDVHLWELTLFILKILTIVAAALLLVYFVGKNTYVLNPVGR